MSRSIPACTGEPEDWARKYWQAQVYPRVYGGTVTVDSFTPGTAGLSPRVRGNPAVRPGQGGALGSIPACTGEPSGRLLVVKEFQVYPRVYGGTPFSFRVWVGYGGLSPRVRGNPTSAGPPGAECRSIPACTGEPAEYVKHEWAGAVYPRVYGGTSGARFPQRTKRGLSPRVRGNRPWWSPGSRGAGSIPACTGEP